MGWYAAIGRPLFFSLPPETAHRLATTLLGLPLPWSRVGAAADVLALRTQLCGVPLATPIGLAAGFDKTCAHLSALGRMGFGYTVGGTITRAARLGNAEPRIARSPRTRSMVNAMGLPNPGAEVAAHHLERDGLRSDGPRFVSLADEEPADVFAALDLVAAHADGIELNASCPNVSWGRDRDNEAHLRTLVTGCRERTAMPVMVKLPPFLTPVEREVVVALARVAHAMRGHMRSPVRTPVRSRIPGSRWGREVCPARPCGLIPHASSMSCVRRSMTRSPSTPAEASSPPTMP